MGNAPAVENWHKKHPSKPRLEALYRETGSIVGVARALRVARSTAHIWMKTAGLKMRSPGTDKRRKAENAEKRYLAAHQVRAARVSAGKPVEGVERRHCYQNRHWRGEVIVCVEDAGPVCVTCTRGYEHGLREVINASNGFEPGTHEGRRKGSRSRE